MRMGISSSLVVVGIIIVGGGGCSSESATDQEGEGTVLEENAAADEGSATSSLDTAPTPPVEATIELDPASLLATGTYVTFESLMKTGDVVKITKDAQGGTFRAFGAGAFQAILDRLPAGKGVTFAAGTYEVNTPGWGSLGQGAVRVPKGCIGMIGVAPPGTSFDKLTAITNRTVIRVKPNTAPAKNVAGGWFQIGFSGSQRFDIANLHFEGTDQGMQVPSNTNEKPGPGNDGTSQRLFTNVFAYNTAAGSTARDILSTGWYGNNGAPPGETFGFQWYGSTNGVLTRVAVDGRRAKGGPIYGSAGITFGNSVGASAIDSTAHHTGDAGFVGFQSVNCTTRNLVLGDPADHVTAHVTRKKTSGDWLNHERTAGFKHYNTKLNTYAVGRSQLEPITHSGDSWVLSRDGKTYPTAAGSLELIDPVYTGTLFSGKIAISSWNPYGGAASSFTGKTWPSVRKADGTKIPYKYNFGTGWLDK